MHLPAAPVLLPGLCGVHILPAQVTTMQRQSSRIMIVRTGGDASWRSISLPVLSPLLIMCHKTSNDEASAQLPSGPRTQWKAAEIHGRTTEAEAIQLLPPLLF